MDIKSEIELGARVLIWSGAAYAGYKIVKAGLESGISFFSENEPRNLTSEIRLQTQELTQVVNELEEVVAEGEAVVAYGRENVERWERVFEQEDFDRRMSLGSKV